MYKNICIIQIRIYIHSSSASLLTENIWQLSKKTVAMHEVFLQRLAAHPVLRLDVNFKVFLEYDQEVH